MKIKKIAFVIFVQLFNIMMLYGESDSDNENKLIVYDYGRTWENYYIVREEIDFYKDGLIRTMKYYTHGEKGDTYLIWTIDVVRKGDKVYKYVTEKGKKELELYYEIKKDGRLVINETGEYKNDKIEVRKVGLHKYVYTFNDKIRATYYVGLKDINVYHAANRHFQYHFDKNCKLYLIEQDSESPYYNITVDKRGRHILYKRDSNGLFLDYLEIVAPKIKITPEVAIQNMIIIPVEDEDYLMPFVIGYH